MKNLMVSLATAAALSVVTADAGEVMEFPMKDRVKVSALLLIGYPDRHPLMEVDAFCKLNAEVVQNCSADAYVKPGDLIKIQT